MNLGHIELADGWTIGGRRWNGLAFVLAVALDIVLALGDEAFADPGGKPGGAIAADVTELRGKPWRTRRGVFG